MTDPLVPIGSRWRGNGPAGQFFTVTSYVDATLVHVEYSDNSLGLLDGVPRLVRWIKKAIRLCETQEEAALLSLQGLRTKVEKP